MHNMLAIYRHKGHSSRNSSPVISLILRNAEDDDIDNSRVSIKDDSNLGLFIDYMQSGTIRRSRQMHYHRNHLSLLLLCNASLVHCFLVLGAIYFWWCVFGSMHCQLYRAGLLPQWRIYFILRNPTKVGIILRNPEEVGIIWRKSTAVKKMPDGFHARLIYCSNYFQLIFRIF